MVHLTGKPERCRTSGRCTCTIGEVFANGYVNTKVMEFVGEGVIT